MRQLDLKNSEIKITPKEEYSLERYLQEIGKVDLLTPEEEKDLAKKIKLWDQKALEKLIKANLRFVVSVAKQYLWQWLSLSDLINEWNIWLAKAARRFEDKSNKFISYAVRRIRQAILQALAENSSLLSMKNSRYGQRYKLWKIKEELWEWATEKELAKAMGVWVKTLREIEAATYNVVAWDAPVDEWDSWWSTWWDIYWETEDSSVISYMDDVSLADFNSENLDMTMLPWVSELNESWLRAVLKDYVWFICKWNDAKMMRAKNAVIWRYWLDGDWPWSVEEIAEHYEVSTTLIDNDIQKVIRRLRQAFTKQKSLDKSKLFF